MLREMNVFSVQTIPAYNACFWLQLASRNFFEPRRRRWKALGAARGGRRHSRGDKDRNSLDGEMAPLTGVAVKKDGYQAA